MPVARTTDARTSAVRSKVTNAIHRLVPPTLICLGGLWLLQGVFAHTASHGVLIQNLNYDAGTVKAGSTVTDKVRLINLSSAPIEVDAQPGCGCTVASVPEKPLTFMAGEIVKLEIDTNGMKKGYQERKILFQMRTKKEAWEQVASVKFQVQ